MTKVVFLLLLIGHVIGDFYILPKRMTEKRQETFGKLLLHSALYLLILTIVTIPVLRLPILLWVLIISAVHFLTDLIVYFIKKKKPDEKTDAVLYSVDQFVHILVILIASFSLSYVYINYIPFIQNGLKRIQIDFSDILSWTLAALIILQPASVTIRKLLYRYRPVSNDVQKGYLNAGAFIGILERCIILLFLYMGQYSAIGLVLTAKSIARYNKIVEDPKFSEYYLLGTLLSVMSVLLAYLLIF